MSIVQYSVNVADLTKDIILGQLLIAPVVPNRTIINAEPKNIDGRAVVLECEEERAQAIIHIIRQKYGKHELRCYKNKTRI